MTAEPDARQAAIIRRYLDRRQLYPFQVHARPRPRLGLIVVIPCFDEPDITRTLDSIGACRPPPCAVEVLVVVNAPAGAPMGCLERNAAALATVGQWTRRQAPGWLRCHGIWHAELARRHAGVGLARKIGMDEAAGRLAEAPGGIIACLDADCLVAENYLTELHRVFDEHSDCPGASVYFEHPVDRQGGALHRAIAEYELHLRYYVAGQRAAGFPYAFHTIGSAMACRAVSYAAEGGMNRRQGGEDFYFTQKLITLGGYRSLGAATVYPGVRLSHRVPFGTGPAARRAVATATPLASFAPEVFRDLKRFCDAVADWAADGTATDLEEFPPALRDFLKSQEFPAALAEIRANVASPAAFAKRLFRWCNAFRFMKFAQFASRGYYPKRQVTEAARELAALLGAAPPSGFWELLDHFRRLDRASGVR